MDIGGELRRTARFAGRLVPYQIGKAIDRARPGSPLSDAVRDRVVLVTGASSGIGRATALRIGAAGGTVLLVARGADALEEVAAEIADGGGSAHAYPCDLVDSEATDAMADRVLAEHGRVHVLVNNAGHSIRRSIERSYDRLHDYERTIRLNYLAGVQLTLRFLPGMRERGGGQIVNVSTMGVQVGTPRFSAYISSKAALDAFAACLAAEVLDQGVTVSTVNMPLVRTPMIEPTRLYSRMPALTPEQAADRICDAIAYRPKRVATQLGNLTELVRAVSPGAIDAVLNGAYRMLPDELDRPARRADAPAEAEGGAAEGEGGAAEGEGGAAEGGVELGPTPGWDEKDTV